MYFKTKTKIENNFLKKLKSLFIYWIYIYIYYINDWYFDFKSHKIKYVDLICFLSWVYLIIIYIKQKENKKKLRYWKIKYYLSVK